MNRRKKMLQKRKKKQTEAEPKVLVFGNGTAAVKGEWTPKKHGSDEGSLTMFMGGTFTGNNPNAHGDAPRPASYAEQA